MLVVNFFLLLAITYASSVEVLLSHPNLPSTDDCGINPVSDRILGGTITGLDEYPWLVAIEYKDKQTNKLDIKCGGSLISKKHVVTAAHCIMNEYTIARAWLGDWKLSSNPDCQYVLGVKICNEKVQKINIVHSIYHPKYDDEEIKYDIGVLFLEREARFNNFVKPICLPSSKLKNLPKSTMLYSTGWGVTEKGTTSDIKLKVELPLKLNNECDVALKEHLSSNQLCVGGVDGKDTCGGDSGGPLMYYYTNNVTGDNHYYLLGVVSYGYDCGTEGYPAVYTRVPNFVNWIMTTITNNPAF